MGTAIPPHLLQFNFSAGTKCKTKADITCPPGPLVRYALAVISISANISTLKEKSAVINSENHLKLRLVERGEHLQMTIHLN